MESYESKTVSKEILTAKISSIFGIPKEKTMGNMSHIIPKDRRPAIIEASEKLEFILVD